MNVVGPRVRQARLTSGLTQSALAARLELRGMKIDRAGVAKIEGRLRQVSDSELLALANALGVSPAWLFEADTTK